MFINRQQLMRIANWELPVPPPTSSPQMYLLFSTGHPFLENLSTWSELFLAQIWSIFSLWKSLWLGINSGPVSREGSVSDSQRSAQERLPAHTLCQPHHLAVPLARGPLFTILPLGPSTPSCQFGSCRLHPIESCHICSPCVCTYLLSYTTAVPGWY